jgi:hypothetical protein
MPSPSKGEVTMSDKIITLHPQAGKSGVNISKEKYDIIRKAILEILDAQKEMTFKNLTQEIHAKLEGRFDGSIPWYVTTVKLDLEARGEVERVANASPQRLRLANA